MFWLVIIVVVAAAAWRLGYWPFDGSFPQLPKYGEKPGDKGGPPGAPKP